ALANVVANGGGDHR
ncbi:hypothetical protein CISIN_1g0285091mg, partial [Citrus sinensis]